jgi:predicted ATP-dependent endonuclease of OLD family
MGVLSLQSIILLLQLAQHRATQGKSFCLALEEPELHVPPGLQRRLIHRVHALSTQTIVSTHSPLVASYSEPTNVLMLQIDKGQLAANRLLDCVGSSRRAVVPGGLASRDARF